METKQITVSFVVTASGKVAHRGFTIDWIKGDDTETIADAIKDAILSIE
jgi:membrane-bound inhibitor of C-type lysozyme